ncbi:AAA family ATPase [Streptomyces nodosus]
MTRMLLALEGTAGAGKSTLRGTLLAAAQREGIRLGHIGQFSWLSLESTRTLIALRAGRPAATSGQALAAARRDLELHTRHNLAPALARGPLIADRLTLSTATLLALVHHRPVTPYVRALAELQAARADLTVLLTTEPSLCHARLAERPTARRFGEDLPTATRLAGLYDQAATAWTEATGLPVLRLPCTSSTDLDQLTAACLERLRDAAPSAARI